MRVRFLGHSCVEIVGRRHILIDPDFTHNPEPDVEYILVSHAHRDHIGRVAELAGGKVVAAPDVCEIAARMGVPEGRLLPVQAGDTVANIQVLEGFSRVGGAAYNFFHFIFRRRRPDPGGTPLSFLVEDEMSLLHIGDADTVELAAAPDILCLPWRTSPFWPERYKRRVIGLAQSFAPQYVLPIHYDLPGTEADPAQLRESLGQVVLDGSDWHSFKNGGKARD